MYEEFKMKKLMGDSDYVPFNEAMCVNASTKLYSDNKVIEFCNSSQLLDII